MEQMTIVIAEDDVASRTLLAEFIQLLPEYVIVGEAATGGELIQLVKEKEPNIILVDIGMPGLNGVEAATACKKIFPELMVIFTTGYEEFAVGAFDLGAVDYLVKPIERIRLFVALEKAKQALELHKSYRKKQHGQISDKLSLKSGNTFVYIGIDDILFIEKQGKKSVIHTMDDQLETVESLQTIEQKLPASFYKTHRSYVVNMKKIIKIESFGETYIAHFAQTEERAYISKLKINKVHQLIGS